MFHTLEMLIRHGYVLFEIWYLSPGDIYVNGRLGFFSEVKKLNSLHY